MTQEWNQVRVRHETSGKQERTDLIRIHARHIVRFEIQLRHVLGAGSIPLRCERVRRFREGRIILDWNGQCQPLAEKPFLSAHQVRETRQETRIDVHPIRSSRVPCSLSRPP